ncbi:hypothetical protein ACHQM5_021501 [Ranunculus cassubicifolius]
MEANGDVDPTPLLAAPDEESKKVESNGAVVDPIQLIAGDDEMSKKVATRKFRVKILMAMQLGIQLLGMLYVYIFGGFDIYAGCLFAMSLSWCVSACIVGVLGLRRNDVRYLEIYCIFSETTSMFAGSLVLIGYSTRFMREKESSGVQTMTTLMGMDPINFYSYLYFQLVGIVELTQACTTSNLIWILSPPKGEVLPITTK